ncbi:MAG: glycosyltransferase family 4 protein [Trueperaceae bacterium]
MKLGYVVKRYPRFSETFVVNEILAHEAAGADLEIFSLLTTVDTHFQDLLARVRSPVTYLAAEAPRAGDLWSALASEDPVRLQAWLPEAATVTAREAYASLVLAAAVRARGIDHLHAHFATSAATVAGLASRLTGVGFTLTAHAKDIFHEDVDPAGLHRTFGQAHAIVTVSDHNVAYLRGVLGQGADGVVRIYNGLDLQAFPFSAPDDRPPVILAVGRLVEKKGFGDLVDACAQLATRGLEFRCRIVGGGPLESALKERVTALGLSGVVTLTGPLPQRDVIDEVRGAAAFAAPCIVGDNGDRDGMPTVLLESMALGTPCVATPVTGIPEAIRHDETGLLVPERCPSALADALQRMLTDRDLRVRLAHGARRRMEEEFDVVRNAARLRSVFRGERLPLAS